MCVGGAGGAGVNMIYAGLKFTGLALSVAGDLAKAVRQDAERVMKEMEADAAAKVSDCASVPLCVCLSLCVCVCVCVYNEWIYAYAAAAKVNECMTH